jgi:putative cardiolipin synthase
VGQRQGQSGFRLLTLSTNALLSRIALIDHAAHSLDLQYYIYHNDATGRLVTQHLLSAADRGVRVRLLLDHLKIAPRKRRCSRSWTRHERVEVRFFNPFSTRSPGALDRDRDDDGGARLNRRMHNKLLIEDNVVRDPRRPQHRRRLFRRELGPALPRPRPGRDRARWCRPRPRAFDQYWNAEFSYPLKAFKARHATDGEIEEARQALTRDVRAFEQSDYAKEVSEDLPDGPSAARRGDWFWGPAELVADKPEKVEADTKEDHARRIRIGPRLKTGDGRGATRAAADLALLHPRRSRHCVLQRARAARRAGEGPDQLARVHRRAARARRLRALPQGPAGGGVQLYELKPAAVEQQKTTGGGGVVGHLAARQGVPGRPDATCSSARSTSTRARACSKPRSA